MSGLLQARLNASKEAVKLVEDGMVLGVGSGSTVELFLKELAKTIREQELDVEVVPASLATEIAAIRLGVKVRPLSEVDELDVAVDGADEVDPNLNLLKGGGGALTREKIVDYCSREYVVIVDSSKLSSKLGERAPFVVEVLPPAWRYVVRALRERFGIVAELRIAKLKNGPIVTDNGNLLLDCNIRSYEGDPEELERGVNAIPGVVDNGLFSLKRPSKVFVGREEGVDVLRLEQ